MDMEVKTKHWENIFAVIQCSYTIDKHIDFFNWLQNSVNDILPHDMLIASWGDFQRDEDKKFDKSEDKSTAKNKLNYDVASNVSGVSTQIIFDASAETDSFMRHLHQEWLSNNRCWFAIHHLEQLDSNHQFNANFLSN